MVSKVTVVALVAIIAIPIMLGYAFNLTETTETEYRTTGEAVNVTQLLHTGTDYTYANADTYQINTKFFGTNNNVIFPYYASGMVSTKTSLPLEEYNYDGIEYPTGIVPGMGYLDVWAYYYFQSNISSADTGYINFTINTDTPITINKIRTVYWSLEESRVYYTYYSGISLVYGHTDIDDPHTLYSYSSTGTYNATGYMVRQHNLPLPSPYSYADISAGYYFQGGSNYSIKLPAYTRSALLTMDLSSYTDNTLFMSVVAGPNASTFIIQKSGTHWYVGNNDDWPANKIELYYDSSRSSNTYQIFIQYNLTNSDMTYDYYTRHIEFRYVGDWPTFIGQTNYYQNFTLDNEFSVSAGNVPSMNRIQFATADGANTPIIRMDDAEFRAFEYLTITDAIYKPGDFKQYPSTTLNNISIYGTSLTFAGNTYTVNKGNISLDGHQIAVNGLTFRSVPNDDLGGYDNLIGNTFISNTAQPGTLTFGGEWSASVSTTAQESYTVTKMEWKAGEFAWNGIDDNFLLCGLVGCVGVFIGCGIYARKRGTGGLLPLMIITGCAAFVFFIML